MQNEGEAKVTERVYDFLLRPAAEEPEGVALEFMGKSFTYHQLAERARQLASGLAAHEVPAAASVALMLPNVPQFAEALYGAWMNGNVVVPMNVLLTAPEVRYVLDDASIRVLFVLDVFLERVEAALAGLENPPRVVVIGQPGRHTPYAALLEAAPRALEALYPIEPDTHVLTIYTSGTTGKPKGAVIDNANVVAQLEMIDSGFEPMPGDRALCVLPLFHVFALNAILNSGLRHRYTVVLHPKFDVAATLKSLETEGITIFCGVPTMYFYLLKFATPETRFPKLRYCVSGGSGMPPRVLHAFEERFGAPIYEGYGLTETTVSVASNTVWAKKVGSVGRLYPGVEAKIVDNEGHELPRGERGEIMIRGPNVMRRYLNRAAETLEALSGGWLHTGDIGYLDDEDYLFVVDRKRDLIIKGGYNIYPREIEDVIQQLPQVAEAAVVGIDDEAKGEHVRACISVRPGAKLTQDELERFLAANLAKYKLPNEYVFMNELPKGASGKILKRELRGVPNRSN
ncbi:MAG TPA: AMP-binding protein [Polyangiales bacterium]|nr:AMP-binding protein [Polyangiales bacterium]